MHRRRFFTNTLPLLGLAALLATGCVSARPDITADTSALKQQQQPKQDYQGLKRKVAIARFSNETEYAKGAFYDKNNDPLGKQAVDILSSRLASSGKFILLERADADAIQKELDYAGRSTSAQKVGADYLIIGSVTEFGRKNTGETGVFSQTKRQIVQAGVNIRLIDVATGEIIYAEEGKGEAETETTTVLGYGAQAGYDATLSDKAISAAISQLVENIINNCMDRPWKSYIISAEDGMILMAGGKKQGVKAGDIYGVYERSKNVKNPQTGMMIEVPGKKVGEVSVLSTGGSTASNEYAVISVTSGTVDTAHPEKYEIRERK